MAIPIDNGIKQPKKQGTGFTNIQRLMQANQSNRLGETVASGVGNQVKRVSQDLGKSQSKFNEEVGKQRIDFQANQNKVGQVMGNVAAATDDDVKAFEKIRAGQYAGPQGLEKIDQIKTQAQLAGQLGQLGSTAGGKVELLKRFAGGPQYTSGQSRLDSLLLGTSGAPQLKQARREAQMLGNQVSAADVNAMEQGKGLKNQTRDLAEQTVKGLRTQTDDIYKAVDKQRQDFLDKQAADLAAAQEGAKTGLFDEEILQQLGLQAGMNTKGVDFSDLIKGTNVNANAYTAANQDQAMKLAALGKLAGSSFDPTESQDLAKFKDNSEIGSLLKQPTIRLTEADKDTLMNRIGRAEADVQAQISEGARMVEQAIAQQRHLNGQFGQELAEQLPQFQATRELANRGRNMYNAGHALKNQLNSKKISIKQKEPTEKDKAGLGTL